MPRPLAVRVLVRALLATAMGLGCVPKAETPLPSQLSEDRPAARGIVVVQSRSGHTARVARVLAHGLGASYLRLSVPPGTGDGFFSTPNRNEPVGYEPRVVDLSRYDLVLLGCPIWYWHPTAFIYAFIKQNDLRGKRVVLFFTYESSLSKDAIAEWTRLVEARGGRVVDVWPFDRSKLDDQALAAAAASRIARWTGMAGPRTWSRPDALDDARDDARDAPPGGHAARPSTAP